jgi:hypothetical protein
MANLWKIGDMVRIKGTDNLAKIKKIKKGYSDNTCYTAETILEERDMVKKLY